MDSGESIFDILVSPGHLTQLAPNIGLQLLSLALLRAHGSSFILQLLFQLSESIQFGLEERIEMLCLEMGAVVIHHSIKECLEGVHGEVCSLA